MGSSERFVVGFGRGFLWFIVVTRSVVGRVSIDSVDSTLRPGDEIVHDPNINVDNFEIVAECLVAVR